MVGGAELAELAKQYARLGHTAVFPAIPPAQAAVLRQRVVAEQRRGGGYLMGTAHLAYEWADALIRSPTVVAAAEACLEKPQAEQAEDNTLLVRETTFWTKEPGSGAFVSKHQDVSFWGLEHDGSDALLTVWVALSDIADEAAGPLCFWSGSHRGPAGDGSLLFAERENPHKAAGDRNMLGRAQNIDDASLAPYPTAIVAPMAAGEAVIFSGRLVHSSLPIAEGEPSARIGCSIRYMTSAVRPRVIQNQRLDYAAVVKGRLRPGTGFVASAPPQADLDADAVAEFERVGERRGVVMSDRSEGVLARLQSSRAARL